MKNRLTQLQTVNISKFLDTVVSVDADGTRYRGTWSDTRVAEKFSVSVNNVRYLRGNLFGKLHFTQKPKPKQLTLPLEGKHTILNTVHDLRSQVSTLESRLAYLERELGVINNLEK